uniref:Cucumber mosaic virus CARNA 5 gene with ORFs I, IIA, and IIB, 5' end, clone X2c n=1 Tax=Cucumber mosaic virus TaxID=12305 RepID=Q66266_9BROM|nr:ORF IIB [Cucumber mosaic virus]
MSATLSTVRSFEPPLSLLAKPGPWFAVTVDFRKKHSVRWYQWMTHAGAS